MTIGRQRVVVPTHKPRMLRTQAPFEPGLDVRLVAISTLTSPHTRRNFDSWLSRTALLGLMLLWLVVSPLSATTWTFDADLDGWIAETQCALSFNWEWSSDFFAGAAFATNPTGGSSSMLLRSGPQDVSGAYSVDVRVNHRYNTETCCDHGYIVYRLDGGAWQRFEPVIGDYNVLDFMYNDPIFGACGNSPDMDLYAGDSSGYINTIGRVETLGATTFELGFFWSSDASFADDGWYINTVTVDPVLPVDCSVSGACLSLFDSSFDGWLAYPSCGLEANGTWIPAADDGRNVLVASQQDGSNSSMVLLSPPIEVAPGDVFELSFMHRFATETCCDHGYVAYRESGGVWQQLPISNGFGYNIFDFMYNDPFLGACGSSPDIDVFAGQSDGYQFSGGTGNVENASILELAFLFTSDASFQSEGWYIDAVLVSTSMFANGFEPGHPWYWSSVAGVEPCAHDQCDQGFALTPSCDPCVAQICDFDPFCCSNSWDATCVGWVASICSQSCS